MSAVVSSAFRNPLKSSACRFFGILFGSSVLSAFSESRSDKVSRRAELFFIIYIVLLSKFICLRLLHPLFGTRSNRRHAAFSDSRLDRRCCPLFRNPVRTKLPAETFHPLRHRGPPCDKRTAAYPSNDVQVGNDLHAIYRIGRFPFCLTAFPTAHTTFPTRTANTSLPQHHFFLLKKSARPTAQQQHVRNFSVPILLCKE